MKAHYIGLAFFLAHISLAAYGYSSNVGTRDFSQKLPIDNIIVIEEHNNTGTNTQWFRSHDGRFQIWMIDNSIEVRRTPPALPGIKQQQVSFSSLDKLHDLKVGDGGRRYDMRIMFNQDILWVEVQPSDSKTAPVKNALMFFGSDADTYNYYLNNSIPYVRYANQTALKKDIQSNYGNKYSPDFINLIHYPPIGRKAMLSILNSGSD